MFGPVLTRADVRDRGRGHGPRLKRQRPLRPVPVDLHKDEASRECAPPGPARTGLVWTQQSCVFCADLKRLPPFGGMKRKSGIGFARAVAQHGLHTPSTKTVSARERGLERTSRWNLQLNR